MFSAMPDAKTDLFNMILWFEQRGQIHKYLLKL